MTDTSDTDAPTETRALTMEERSTRAGKPFGPHLRALWDRLSARLASTSTSAAADDTD